MSAEYCLLNPAQAQAILGDLVQHEQQLSLEILEDTCFSSWLDIGQLQFETITQPPDDADERPSVRAVRQGHYLWRVASEDTLSSQIPTVLAEPWEQGKERKDKKQAEAYQGQLEETGKILREGLQDVARRTLLIWPTFDADISDTLLNRNTLTLVADTSSLIQGGVDFTSTFLHPFVRLKVPAVVPLEVLNSTDRFLTLRRKNKVTYQCLSDHVKSQGGWRALNRLEWHTKASVERPRDEQDPLRRIFDKDTELHGLNLHTVQRSFADRLILEAAKSHRAYVGAEHPVCVLTSDQGLARMALAEGMKACYFDARQSALPFGKVLCGVRFHPNTGQPYSIPLTTLLWELGVAFGRCRIRGEYEFEVVAIHRSLPWSPFMSKEDLLWCRWTVPEDKAGSHQVAPLAATPTTTISESDDSIVTAQTAEPIAPADDLAAEAQERDEDAPVTAYAVSANGVIRLVGLLVEIGAAPDTTFQERLEIKSYNHYRNYRKFLESGDFIEGLPSRVSATQQTRKLWQALQFADLSRLDELLGRIPSYSVFLKALQRLVGDRNWATKLPLTRPDRTVRGYSSLAQIAGAAVFLPSGPYVTPRSPDANVFSRLAWQVYQKLANEDPLVLTGSWLEMLAIDHEIHPVRSRDLLEACHANGFLRRYFEGSAPNWQFEGHTLDVLSTESGQPRVEKVHLYHGDFLSKERASVRMRLELNQEME